MIIITKVGFPVAQMVENLPVMQETGEGNGNPLQYSCLENHVDRGAWWAAVHRVVQLDTTEATQHVCMHWRRK